MNYGELLAALGLETRLDLAEAARLGSCTIKFDSNLEVTLEAENQGEEQNTLQIYTTLGSAPANDRENFFARLLQLHLFGFATDNACFSYDPKLHQVLFFKTVPLSLLSQTEALVQVENFVNQAVRWQEFLPKLEASATNLHTSFGMTQTA